MRKKRIYVFETNLIHEWNWGKNNTLGLDPSKITISSTVKPWWKCGKGHNWQAAVYNRKKGNKCPYCSGQKVCLDNCLATLRPDLKTQWHPTKNGRLTPYGVVCGSGKKVWWQCENAHEWKATVNDRTSCGGHGCPYCSGQKACEDNCLATLRLDLKAQ